MHGSVGFFAAFVLLVAYAVYSGIDTIQANSTIPVEPNIQRYLMILSRAAP